VYLLNQKHNGIKPERYFSSMRKREKDSNSIEDELYNGFSRILTFVTSLLSLIPTKCKVYLCQRLLT
jgi:hypothetical protein